MTSKHMIRIASLSKAITATAVGLLYEQGKLDLDAPVQKYLPSFQPPNPLPPSTQEGTLIESKWCPLLTLPRPSGGQSAMTSTNPGNANGNPEASNAAAGQVQEELAEGEAAKRITTRLLSGHLGGIRFLILPAYTISLTDVHSRLGITKHQTSSHHKRHITE